MSPRSGLHIQSARDAVVWVSSGLFVLRLSDGGTRQHLFEVPWRPVFQDRWHHRLSLRLKTMTVLYNYALCGTGQGSKQSV
ncbi:hypothetical protein Micbo1qcDRAFT_156934, partial [Microdochium bolleyi]